LVMVLAMVTALVMVPVLVTVQEWADLPLA
jgi:hypothetical protein